MACSGLLNPPYQLVKTDDFLYYLMPKSNAASLLVSINLETQECKGYEINHLTSIHAFKDDDLLG